MGTRCKCGHVGVGYGSGLLREKDAFLYSHRFKRRSVDRRAWMRPMVSAPYRFKLAGRKGGVFRRQYNTVLFSVA